MKRLLGNAFIIWGNGFTKPMKSGKKDKIVIYPDGHSRVKSYNETHEDGGVI